MALSPLGQRILMRATQLIQKPGAWIKHNYFGSHGSTTVIDYNRYCSLGAIHRAAMDEAKVRDYQEVKGEFVKAQKEAQDALARTIAAKYGRDRGCAVHVFNDHTETSFQDVKETFCETVKREVTIDADEDDTQ